MTRKLLLLFALAFGGCEQEDLAEANDEGALLEEDSEITTITREYGLLLL